MMGARMSQAFSRQIMAAAVACASIRLLEVVKHQQLL